MAVDRRLIGVSVLLLVLLWYSLIFRMDKSRLQEAKKADDVTHTPPKEAQTTKDLSFIVVGDWLEDSHLAAVC